jgi:murein tripeptide amidase MpaA
MEGFIKWIVSDEPSAKQLLNNTIIKIVPMLNPDGVVVGNFRTSFCGKDLNRLFKSRNTFMYP